MGEMFRDAVIGWAVVRMKGKLADSLTIIPLAVSWDGEDDCGGPDLEKDDEVVAVLPAQPGTFQVWGQKPGCERWLRLGYEIPGASHPDWSQLLIKGQETNGGDGVKGQ